MRVPPSIVVKTKDSQYVRFPGHPTVNQAVIGNHPPLEVAKVNRRRRGDKPHRQMPGLQKSGGRKTCHPLRPLYVMGLALSLPDRVTPPTRPILNVELNNISTLPGLHSFMYYPSAELSCCQFEII